MDDPPPLCSEVCHHLFIGRNIRSLLHVIVHHDLSLRYLIAVIYPDIILVQAFIVRDDNNYA